MISSLILLLAIGVSLGYFVKVVWRRLEPMRRAQPSLPQVQLFPKLWKTFTEVMFQTRVIRGRPLAGVLHALVMWGFFAFAWVSMEHMAAGFSGLANAEPDKVGMHLTPEAPTYSMRAHGGLPADAGGV